MQICCFFTSVILAQTRREKNEQKKHTRPQSAMQLGRLIHKGCNNQRHTTALQAVSSWHSNFGDLWVAPPILYTTSDLTNRYQPAYFTVVVKTFTAGK
jgi:hypothetical protein